MASSPPKRRKTSPVTSIPIENATPRPQRPTATDVPHTAPGRASFLSPTKASLARFNPGLLVRPQSAGGERSKGQEVVERPLDTSAVETPTTANGVWEEVANGHDNAPGAVVDAAQEVVEKRNGEKSPSPGVTIATPARTTRSMAKQGLRASPRRRSRTPAAVASPPPDRVREPLATMNETTQTVQDNRDPRSQLEGDREGQVLKAVQALAHLDGANDEQEPEELELPPTPSQLGLADPVVTKAPAGLLNTPSKRPRKNRALGEALKSSPVKTLPIRRSTISPTKNAAPRFTRRNLGSEAAGMRRRRQESPGVEGRADRDGALSPKRRKRDDLREQLRKLQDEVAMYEKQAESAREVSRDGGRPPIDLASEGDRENLISLLLESNTLTFNAPKMSPSRPLSLLNTFLPFSKPPPTSPRTPTPPLGPIPSHRPVSLADPLPYLTLFTPLTFTSTSTLLPQTATPNQIHHRHLIKTHSPHHLLTATISLTVNTTALHVTALEIPSLSAWAEPELGSWVREKAAGQGVQGMDITGVCWAMGRYWEVALRRAKCWWRCERAFGELIPGGEAGLTPQRKQPSHQKSAPSTTATTPPDPQPTRRDLSRHLGHPTLRLQRDNIELLIQWRIYFDWTGEPESTVCALTGVPSGWTQADARNSLSKIPATFERLVKEGGVFAAVKAVVGVLFP